MANSKCFSLLVDGSRDARGHRFANHAGHEQQSADKCEDCGLWIQQTDSKSVFERKLPITARITPSALRQRTGAGTHHTTCVMKVWVEVCPGVQGGSYSRKVRWLCGEKAELLQPLERVCAHIPHVSMPL